MFKNTYDGKKRSKSERKREKMIIVRVLVFVLFIYELKRKYRIAAKKTADLEAIVMDYQRNLQTPNITTNDVYIVGS